MERTWSTRLKGRELLAFVSGADPESCSPTDLMLEAGYYKTIGTDEGPRQSVRKAAFWEEIARANSLPALVSKGPASVEQIERAAYKVTKKGLAVVGASFTRYLGVEPGDSVKAMQAVTSGGTKVVVLVGLDGADRLGDAPQLVGLVGQAPNAFGQNQNMNGVVQQPTQQLAAV